MKIDSSNQVVFSLKINPIVSTEIIDTRNAIFYKVVQTSITTELRAISDFIISLVSCPFFSHAYLSERTRADLTRQFARRSFACRTSRSDPRRLPNLRGTRRAIKRLKEINRAIKLYFVEKFSLASGL